MKLWQGVLTGVLAYLFFLLASAPAAKVLPWVQPRLQAVRLAGVDGTLWSGSAALATAGPVQLQDARWRFHPFAVLLGRVEVGFEATLAGRPASGRAGNGLLGGPYLADVSATLPAPDLLRWLKLNQARVTGDLALELARVEWLASGVPALTGSANWSSARLSAPVELALGTAQLETRAQAGVTSGKLKASGGALLVDADVELKPDGAYRLDARIRQNGELPAEVGQFLSTFADYNNGSYRFEWSDSLQAR